MPATKKNGKCSSTSLCSALSKSVAGQTGRSKGLIATSLLQEYLGKSTPSPVWYADGDQSPVLVKFCPFCGSDLADRASKFEALLLAVASDLG